jgi:hypothetical protein
MPKEHLTYFGTACQECHKFVPLGQIDIEDNASPSELRRKLTAQKWPGDWGYCERCDVKTPCDLATNTNQPILGHRVDTDIP